MILPFIIEPSKEIMDFFDKNGSVIEIAVGSTYYFLPSWIEERKDGVHFLHMLDNLPEDLLKEVKSMRGAQDDYITYTANDMIAFAKRFLRACNKYNVTPYQLAMYNKEK